MPSPYMIGTSLVEFDSAEAAHAAIAQFDQERINNNIENLPRTLTGDESVAIDTKYTFSSGSQYPMYMFVFRKGNIWCTIEIVSIPDQVTLEMATDIAKNGREIN